MILWRSGDWRIVMRQAGDRRDGSGSGCRMLIYSVPTEWPISESLPSGAGIHRNVQNTSMSSCSEPKQAAIEANFLPRALESSTVMSAPRVKHDCSNYLNCSASELPNSIHSQH